MSAGRSLVLLAVLLAPAAAAQPGSSVIPSDDAVWAKWSLTHNLHTKDEMEAAITKIDAGQQLRPSFIIYNNHSTPIYNVTTVIIPRNITLVRLEQDSTWAGDPPTRHYSHSASIGPQRGGLVPLWLHVAPTARGPFTLDVLVFFDAENGTRHHSVTTIRGEVAGGTPMADALETPGLSVATTALLCAMVGLVLRPIRRHRPRQLP